MGSFTSLASKQLLHALFPASAPGTGISNLVPLSSADNTGASFKIYNQTAASTSSTYGIYAGTSLGFVNHRIDLILGSNSTLTLVNSLTDAYILINGLNASATGASAGTVGFPVSGNYVGYKGMTFTGAATGNHMWSGWTVQGAAETQNPIGSWRVDSVGQIGFPTNNTNTVYAWGFTLSACGLAATGASPAINSTVGSGAGELDMPTSSTQLLATTTAAGTRPVIFAYGDLSAGRAINSGDTPVFTTGAIKITLD